MAVHICPTCGNDELDRDDGGVYRCPVCDQPAEPVIAKMRADLKIVALTAQRDLARDRCVWLDGKVAEAIRLLESHHQLRQMGPIPDALAVLKAVE